MEPTASTTTPAAPLLVVAAIASLVLTELRARERTRSPGIPGVDYLPGIVLDCDSSKLTSGMERLPKERNCATRSSA